MHYKTEQRKRLLAYMAKHCDCSFTIDELYEKLKETTDSEEMPGKSTVYRMVPQLVSEGLVKRFAKENSRQFVYQMVAGSHCASHLHMKCSVCGKLYHMEDQESERILEQVFKKHHFAVDEGNTVLIGKCGDCGCEFNPQLDSGHKEGSSEHCKIQHEHGNE